MADGIVVLRGFALEAEASIAASVLQANGIRAEMTTKPVGVLGHSWVVLVQADDATFARALLDTPVNPPLLQGAQRVGVARAKPPQTRPLTRLAGNFILCVAIILLLDLVAGLLGLTPNLGSSRADSILSVLLLIVGNALRQRAIAS